MRHIFFALALSSVFALFGEVTQVKGRAVSDFNDGWEFSRDRKTWSSVEVPHDWAIEGPFNPNGEAGSGKLPWKGVGYYRKRLVLEKPLDGKRVFLDFDGIMCDGTVFVNDQPCGHQPYGYLGLRADATPYLYAGTNTVIVRADTTKLASRWYPGAGLYRRVRRIVTDSLYLDDRDIAVTTPEVSSARAVVNVKGLVTSRLMSDTEAVVTVTVEDPSGALVASRQMSVNVPKCEQGGFSIDLPVNRPALWNLKPHAALYAVRINVAGGGAKDEMTVRTGFRSFKFDPERGFFLNGERIQLQGVCLHSDLGILGMAYNRSAMRRQLLRMRDMGVNALRTSHNPPAPETLELCDELGIFVWDECFDKWNGTSGRCDEPLEEYVERALREFVRRDRNHPSVFVWSIGNEIPAGGGFAPGQETWNMPHTLGTTAERCARFRNAVRSVDETRPVGIGSCFTKGITRHDYDCLDIVGWNYGDKYSVSHKCNPQMPVLGSETASALSEYGFYADRLPTNKTDYAVECLRVDSYDRNAARWSDIPDLEFERMERDTYVGGEFVWTGIDYLGEPTPYDGNVVSSHPEVKLSSKDKARSAYFGIYDLLVMPKDRAYLYRSHWNKEAFTLHIVPDHWTFPERTGRKMPVYVYTSADEAELFVNGVSQGRRKKDPSATMAKGYYAGMARYRLMWNDVTYKPGEVKAVAYGTDGRVLGEEVLRTADTATRVVLESESDTLPEDGDELVFVKVSLADVNGVPVLRDNRRIRFKVAGAGKLVSVGNADPHGHESFKDTSSHPLYNGRAAVVVKRLGKGPVTVIAESEGLAVGEVRFECRVSAGAGYR